MCNAITRYTIHDCIVFTYLHEGKLLRPNYAIDVGAGAKCIYMKFIQL